MKYYFLKTLSDKGRNRLRPLSGQNFEDGLSIDPTLNCQSDKTIRTMYPLGTVYATDSLTISSGYYVAGRIFPVSVPAGEIMDSSHQAPKKMLDAYAEFIGASPEFSSTVEPPTEKTKVTYLSKLRARPEFNVPSIKDDGFYVEDNTWYLLLRNILNQVNTMLIGPTGTGKTELVMLACEKVGLPCHVYDMGSMLDPISSLLGVHRLREGGVSEFDYAKFTKDITEPGVILLDELSRAPLATNNILFPCLDSRRSLPVEIAGGKDLRTIEVHPECTFIATANIGAEYTGTMSMDKALVNRFFPIELGTIPEIYEKRVLSERCKIDSRTSELIVKLATSIRKMFEKQEISSGISTRETLMLAELVYDGWPLVSAAEMVLLPIFEGTSSEGERGIVKRQIMAM